VEPFVKEQVPKIFVARVNQDDYTLILNESHQTYGVGA
jgi:hypothetical protein